MHQSINCSPEAKELTLKIHEQSRRITSSTYSNKEIKACENIIKVKSENEKRLKSVVKELESRCERNNEQKKVISNEIKSQFSVLERKLMEKVKSAVNNESVQNGSTAKTKKTFAEVAKTNQQQPNLANIKNLLRSEKIEDQLEEQRKRSKQSNIIIHGVPESDDKDRDTDFLDQLLDDTGNDNVDNEQELNVSRIGQTSNSNRPIKVVFTDIHEKRVFMQSLTKLKENEKYAKISITEDFTRTERELIKHWKNNADQKNRLEKNQNYVWRVRGSPRDSRGLYLKKIFTKTCI